MVKKVTQSHSYGLCGQYLEDGPPKVGGQTGAGLHLREPRIQGANLGKGHAPPRSGRLCCPEQTAAMPTASGMWGALPQHSPSCAPSRSARHSAPTKATFFVTTFPEYRPHLGTLVSHINGNSNLQNTVLLLQSIFISILPGSRTRSSSG
jgi:hypothetical protein